MWARNGGKRGYDARKSAEGIALNMVPNRLREVMRQYNLSRAELAAILCTPLDTLNGWLDKGKSTPACLGVLLGLIEKRSQVRAWIGIGRNIPAAPRGKPFKKGNPYRFKHASRAAKDS